MVQGTSQIALIYRVYYKCMRTNMNVGALDRRVKGETTLIQTTDPTAKEDSIVDEQDDREQSPPVSITDMEQPPDQEPLNIMVDRKSVV